MKIININETIKEIDKRKDHADYRLVRWNFALEEAIQIIRNNTKQISKEDLIKLLK